MRCGWCRATPVAWHHPHRTHDLRSGSQDQYPPKNSVQKTICCNSTSNAPDDGRMRPKHVELRIQGQSKKILNICDSAPVSRRRTLATVVLCSVDFKLHFDTSHITPFSMSHELPAMSERVFSAFGDFLQVEE